MVKICVLRFMLPLICHMNLWIKPGTIQIAPYQRLELFLVELDHFTNCFTEGIEQLPGLLTVDKTCHGSLPSRPNTSCARKSNSYTNLTLPSFVARYAIRVFFDGNVSVAGNVSGTRSLIKAPRLTVFVFL